MIDIIDLVERIKRYAKLDYLQVVITDKGNLVLYDYEEKRTLRNCKNKLCHNIIALEWLKNEALATSEYDCELDNAIEYLKKNRRKGRKMKKAYITLNYLNGWMVVLDGVHVDCTSPIFDSGLINDVGLKKCVEFCKNENIRVIRVCK